MKPESVAFAPLPEADAALRKDYARCASITRRSSSNFYYAFMLLPAERRPPQASAPPHPLRRQRIREPFVTGVRAIAHRLKAAQVKFFNELHDGVYGLTIYVADPDGNKVELFQEGLKLAD